MQRSEGWKLWPNPYVWIALGIVGLIDLTWLWVLGDQLLLGIAFFQMAVPALAVAFAALVWAKNERVQTAAIGTAFVVLAWPVLRLFNHLVMTTAMPMQDDLLGYADAMFGFNWLHYVYWLDGQHFFTSLLAQCYNSLTMVSCVAFLAIVLTGDLEAAAEFIGLFFAAAVLISSLGMFFPANGAMAHFAAAARPLNYIPNDVGTWFVAPLHDVRTNPHHVFDVTQLPGLTAFPSFHTAMGVIILYCCRNRKLLFLAAMIYVPMMVAAALVFGGHYLVDIITGVAVTLALIAIQRRSLIRGSRIGIPAPQLMAGRLAVSAMDAKLK